MSRMNEFDYGFTKIFIWGCGGKTRRWFDPFPQLLEYIDFFIDTYYEQKTYMGVRCLKPGELNTVIGRECLVLISVSDRNYLEVYHALKANVQIEENQIMKIDAWALHMLSRHPEIKLMPTKARIDACNLCQLNCADCYMRKHTDIKVGAGMLKYSDFKEFLDDNPRIKEIELSDNGEVFLNSEFVDIIKYSYEKNVSITLINGVNLNTITEETIKKLVEYQIKCITISIDGASNEIYQIYRKNGDFDTVIDNIRRINKWKKDLHSDYPILQWQYVLMEHNECDVEKAISIANELGMHIFFKLSWSGDYIPKDVEKMKKLTGLECFNRKAFLDKYGKNYMRHTCEHMIWQPQINWDGSLLGCCDNYSYGDWGTNVFESGFIDSLNTDTYRRMVLALLGCGEGISEDAPCLNCYNYSHNISKGNYIIV